MDEDKDQQDADRLQKALLKKENSLFDWDFFALGAIIIAIVFGLAFIFESIANWMSFYD